MPLTANAFSASVLFSIDYTDQTAGATASVSPANILLERHQPEVLEAVEVAMHGTDVAVDVLIAGTALERADPRVLTRNVDEFDRVAELTVETY